MFAFTRTPNGGIRVTRTPRTRLVNTLGADGTVWGHREQDGLLVGQIFKVYDPHFQQKKLVVRSPRSEFDPERHMSDADARMYAGMTYAAGASGGLIIGLMLAVALTEIF